MNMGTKRGANRWRGISSSLFVCGRALKHVWLLIFLCMGLPGLFVSPRTTSLFASADAHPQAQEGDPPPSQGESGESRGGLHVLAISGAMRSHALSMVPVLEELSARGHRVTFAIPSTKEARAWFKKPPGNSELLHVGDPDWSLDQIPTPDLKTMSHWEVAQHYVHMAWNYADLLDKPIFSSVPDIEAFVQKERPDVAFVSMASMGSGDVLKRTDTPFVTFYHASMLTILAAGTPEYCRYPYMRVAPTVTELKTSLLARLKNHLVCSLETLLLFPLFLNEINKVRKRRGLNSVSSWAELLAPAPISVGVGGPPVSVLPHNFPRSMHLVGLVSRDAAASEIDPDLLRWLDGDGHTEPVLYVSMGTKYKLTDASAASLVTQLSSAPARVLWSLRPAEQERFASLLPSQNTDRWRVEAFTPQPDVLQHPSVKAFLSHCGWGGTTDSLAAGVPVLAYPGFNDQESNAAGLVDGGAGIRLWGDFSNLLEAIERVLSDPSFAESAKRMGEKLLSQGGLARTVEIVEAVARGNLLEADEHVGADPFFLQPQPAVLFLESMILVVLLLVLLACCRFSCWTCRRCCSTCSTCCSWTKRKTKTA
mmetsp:Transcript_8404/g.16321  ORF Transcript_8404/g.16321 Transcript_8404/m.16321 type:complete len:594 (-) Transcript_8404:44-1825(-)